MSDQALCPTKHCTVCRPSFMAGQPVYKRLVKRGRFWCCEVCGTSYGAAPHPDLVCETCDGKGYVETNVHADARYFSTAPAATRVICPKCGGQP